MASYDTRHNSTIGIQNVSLRHNFFELSKLLLADCLHPVSHTPLRTTIRQNTSSIFNAEYLNITTNSRSDTTIPSSQNSMAFLCRVCQRISLNCMMLTDSGISEGRPKKHIPTKATLDLHNFRLNLLLCGKT
jgi:hypothetical protein